LWVFIFPQNNSSLERYTGYPHQKMPSEISSKHSKNNDADADENLGEKFYHLQNSPDDIVVSVAWPVYEK